MREKKNNHRKDKKSVNDIASGRLGARHGEIESLVSSWVRRNPRHRLTGFTTRKRILNKSGSDLRFVACVEEFHIRSGSSVDESFKSTTRRRENCIKCQSLMLTVDGPNVRRQRSCGVNSSESQSIDALQHGIVVVVVTAAVFGIHRRQIKVRSASGTWILKSISIAVWLWVMIRMIGICVWMVVMMVIGAGGLNIWHRWHTASSLSWIVRHFNSLNCPQEVETRRVVASWHDVTAGWVGKGSRTLVAVRACFCSHLATMARCIFVSPFSSTTTTALSSFSSFFFFLFLLFSSLSSLN